MREIKIEPILIKLLEGTATKEEIKLFAEWIKEYPNRQYFSQFKELWHISQDGKIKEDPRELERLKRYVKERKKRRRKIELSIYPIAAAASLLLFLSIWNLLGHSNSNNELSGLAYSNMPIVVEYDNGKFSQNIKGDSRSATMIEPCEMVEEVGERGSSPSKRAQSPNRPSYNSVTTPTGERALMVLPDGSKVYLTSNSYLKYPSTFSEDKREVSLVGRGYFEVSKSEVPFIVNTSNLEIEVLGTTFDVESRNKNENVILVEGSVKVNSITGSKIIKPNQQFTHHTESNRNEITTVDSKLLTMWKDGVLIVNGERFDHLLESLSEWYGVKIINRATISQKEKFYGRFDREDIAAAIKTVSISAKIKYKVIGGYLIITN
ncbi:MAG: FecR family protein [Bacteroidales bacterium]